VATRHLHPEQQGGRAPDLPRETILRELRHEDLEPALEIERRVFSNPWGAAAFRSFLRPGPSFSRVAVVEDRLAGYALGWCAGGQAELMNLAVDPRWRRVSIGSSLLRWTLETCASRGASEIFLEVRVSNAAAQRLYRRHGFEPCGRRRHYYTNPREDAVVLRAPLPPEGGGAAGA
jgi:ribosomal-protein-alanine N-acetyltransferase